MLDRPSRDKAATMIRRLASGRLAASDYDVDRDFKSADEGVRAVLDAGWGLYSDYRDYRLRGEDALPPEGMAAVARCVLFLKTDLEYEWPPLHPSLITLLLALLTLGITVRRSRRRWERSGDHHVWPFRRYADYKQALANPPFLTDTMKKGAA